jgi:spore maturation protein A
MFIKRNRINIIYAPFIYFYERSFYMINTIWFFLILIGILYGTLSGNLGQINNIIIEQAEEGVTFGIGLVGIMAFWMGIMNIAEKSGLIKAISKGLRPIIGFLFPQIPKGHPAERWILMNFIANMFGVGNGATAFGLKAMKELNTLNPDKKRATNAMAMFLIINMSSLQLVPLSVIKIRHDYGAENPTSIIGLTLLATFLSTLVAVIVGKIFEGGRRC